MLRKKDITHTAAMKAACAQNGLKYNLHGTKPQKILVRSDSGSIVKVTARNLERACCALDEDGKFSELCKVTPKNVTSVTHIKGKVAAFSKKAVAVNTLKGKGTI